MCVCIFLVLVFVCLSSETPKLRPEIFFLSFHSPSVYLKPEKISCFAVRLSMLGITQIKNRSSWGISGTTQAPPKLRPRHHPN
jgi:hypothetical protein